MPCKIYTLGVPRHRRDHTTPFPQRPVSEEKHVPFDPPRRVIWCDLEVASRFWLHNLPWHIPHLSSLDKFRSFWKDCPHWRRSDDTDPWSLWESDRDFYTQCLVESTRVWRNSQPHRCWIRVRNHHDRLEEKWWWMFLLLEVRARFVPVFERAS